METAIYIPGQGGQLWPRMCQHLEPPRGAFSLGLLVPACQRLNFEPDDAAVYRFFFFNHAFGHFYPTNQKL